MRHGLKRPELACACVIIALLVALAVPAVQQWRAAAVRMQCSNNLRQLGLATCNYVGSSDHFPPGTMLNAALSPEQRLSFFVALLPYIESDPTYSQLAKTEPWDSPKNIDVMDRAGFKYFQCPAWTGGTSIRPPPVGHLAIGNYVGVAGVGMDAATRPPEAPGIGIFGYDRSTQMKDITDGTANTLLLIETTHELGPWIRGGPATVRGLDTGSEPPTGADRPFGGTHLRHAWTYQKRADGFNVGFADASVRYITNDINLDVLRALATIAGGEEVPANW
ncbi:DUF1559 domain-containing protein [Gemmata sp. G18]|uniref:DUF1559 domain-containing protein n=1 Tax=Gemmata palustris TaxID=2822762 RepID=A0ABS5C0I3_9BACT|nr:DUF1559 domain-containing protein [Gemmata palustris]MBP3959385.1 DUF1559 domain-containing protein [Gemmata palustris]